MQCFPFLPQMMDLTGELGILPLKKKLLSVDLDLGSTDEGRVFAQ